MATTPHLPTLPPELISQLCLQLTSHDLSILCRVSKRMTEIFRPILYKNVDLAWGSHAIMSWMHDPPFRKTIKLENWTPEAGAKKEKLFIQSLLLNPQLGQLVQHLSWTIDDLCEWDIFDHREQLSRRVNWPQTDAELYYDVEGPTRYVDNYERLRQQEASDNSHSNQPSQSLDLVFCNDCSFPHCSECGLPDCEACGCPRCRNCDNCECPPTKTLDMSDIQTEWENEHFCVSRQYCKHGSLLWKGLSLLINLSSLNLGAEKGNCACRNAYPETFPSNLFSTITEIGLYGSLDAKLIRFTLRNINPAKLVRLDLSDLLYACDGYHTCHADLQDAELIEDVVKPLIGSCSALAHLSIRCFMAGNYGRSRGISYDEAYRRLSECFEEWSDLVRSVSTTLRSFCFEVQEWDRMHHAADDLFQAAFMEHALQAILTSEWSILERFRLQYPPPIWDSEDPMGLCWEDSEVESRLRQVLPSSARITVFKSGEEANDGTDEKEGNSGEETGNDGNGGNPAEDGESTNEQSSNDDGEAEAI